MTLTNDDIIRMAREAGYKHPDAVGTCEDFAYFGIERFANLVADKATEEANARANKSWALMCEKMVANERENCAKDAEWCIQNHLEHLMPERIRARSNT